MADPESSSSAAAAAAAAEEGGKRETPSTTGYHYWHRHANELRDSGANTIAKPQLLETMEVPATPESEKFLKIVGHAWLDDGAAVKVYLEFAKFGQAATAGGRPLSVAEGAVEVEDSQVESEFAERSVDVKVRNVAAHGGKSFRFQLAGLSHAVDPAKSRVRIIKGKKLILTLGKVEEDTVWSSLVSK